MTELIGAPVQPSVLLRVENGLGRITLNRPRAINALDHEMIHLITPVLQGWIDDAAVSAVVLDGAGERGLCAGGDIKAIHADAVNGTETAPQYWIDEYQLDVLIAEYPKPFLALMDGIVMGGGVGLAGHAAHRVVTERSMVGLPEVGIGLVPDVGGTYLLAQAPGLSGLHLGLTAGRMSGADAIHAGFADHFVPSDQLDALVQAVALDGIDAVSRFAQEPPTSALAGSTSWIDRDYAHDTAEQIVAALQAAPEPAAQKAALAILAASPTAVTGTLRAVRQVREQNLSLEQAFNVEFALACKALRHPDLAEGIRAQVIDKDRNPSWQPPTLAQVPDLSDWFVLPSALPFPDADSEKESR